MSPSTLEYDASLFRKCKEEAKQGVVDLLHRVLVERTEEANVNDPMMLEFQSTFYDLDALRLAIKVLEGAGEVKAPWIPITSEHGKAV